MTKTKPNLHGYIVNTGALPTLNAHRIEAAYYKTEGGFTTFRDSDHQAVFTVRDDHLVSVERATDSTPISDFRDLLLRADVAVTGKVTGSISRSDYDPGGRRREYEYEIQVAAVSGSVSDLEQHAAGPRSSHA